MFPMTKYLAKRAAVTSRKDTDIIVKVVTLIMVESSVSLIKDQKNMYKCLESKGKVEKEKTN